MKKALVFSSISIFAFVAFPQNSGITFYGENNLSEGVLNSLGEKPNFKVGKDALMKMPIPWNEKLKPRDDEKCINHKEGLNKKSN